MVPRHWRPVHIPQVVTLYCTDLLLLRAGRKVYCGHRHGQRRYWRSLALKVSSGWRLTDHREGQKHTNLDVISPTLSSAPAHVQATTAYGRMDLHFHRLNLRTKWSASPPAASTQQAQYPRMGDWVRSHSRSKYHLPLPGIEIQFLGCTACTAARKVSYT